MTNKLIERKTYRIALDSETLYEISEIIRKEIDNLIPPEHFPRIEIRGQGIKRGTRFWSSMTLAQMIARIIGIYLRDHVHLNQKEIKDE